MELSVGTPMSLPSLKQLVKYSADKCLWGADAQSLRAYGKVSELTTVSNKTTTPVRIPMANTSMKGRRLPQDRLQRSLREPKIGVTKKPMRGGSAQTRVICSCCTPIFSRIGDTKAVSAAYENSIPITAADMRTSSERVFLLKQNCLSVPSVLRDTQLWKEAREIWYVSHVKWFEEKRK